MTGFVPARPAVGVVNLEDASSNPYLARLVEALADRGVCTAPVRLKPLQVVRARRAGVRVVHVHWPEYLLRASPRAGFFGRGREAIALARVAAALMVCRATRVRVVWTVHNLGSHDVAAPWYAAASYRLVAAVAERFVVHSAAAGRQAARRFRRAGERLVVAPHGNYDGAYPPSPAGAREAVRRQLGVADDDVVLVAFGEVRPCKRLLELAELVDAAAGACVLLVAGRPTDAEYGLAVQAAADRSPWIHADLRRIPDAEVAGLYAAADLAVLHYEEAFSSGALLLALTESTAVVLPTSAAAAEVADFPALAMYDGAGLLDAVRRITQVSATERADAARLAAERASWERAADQHLVAYGLARAPH